MTDLDVWLGLDLAPDPWRRPWKVPLRVCAGNGRLFGGSALAAAISCVEGATGRVAKWVAAQYVRPVEGSASLVLELTVYGAGRTFSHVAVRAMSDSSVLLFTASLVLAANEGAPVQLSTPAPRVPPGDSVPRDYRFAVSPSVRDELDVRIADPDQRTDRLDLWARMRTVPTMTPAVVALLADHLAFAVEHLSAPGGAISTISSTLSFGHVRATGWVHLGVAVQPLGDGLWHGAVTVASEARDLLATGTQLIQVGAGTGTAKPHH